MNEFLFKNNNPLKSLRAEQLLGKLREEEAKAVTQSDLDRLRQQYERDISKMSFSPKSKWNRALEISHSDLPQSTFFEDYARNLAHDLQAIYMLNAAWREQLMSAYNMVVGDLSLLQAEAQKISDKVRLLGVSLSEQVDVDYHTDSLLNSAGIDQSEGCHVEKGITLKREGTRDLTQEAAFEILGQGVTSNGVPGNRHEVVLGEKNEFAKSLGMNDGSLQFVGASNPRDVLSAIHDGSYDTWFEYEIFDLDSDLKNEVFQNFGLYNNDPQKTLWVASTGSDKPNLPLRLVLKATLPQISDINLLQVIPYIPRRGFGPTLERVETSLDGNTWTEIPRNGGDLAQLNRKLGAIVRGSEFGGSDVVSEEILRFPTRRAKYLKIVLRADTPYETDVGHTYYEKGTGETKFRVDGPDQGVPVAPYAPPSDVAMLFESVRGKRYAIGLREVTLRSHSYSLSGEVVSKNISARGGMRKISRATLLVDDEVPQEWWGGNFALRSEFIRYFISKDGGANWLPITPDGHPYGPDDPPRFYDFSDEEEVRSIKFKVALRRPADAQGTPIVKRVAIKMEMHA